MAGRITRCVRPNLMMRPPHLTRGRRGMASPSLLAPFLLLGMAVFLVGNCICTSNETEKAWPHYDPCPLTASFNLSQYNESEICDTINIVYPNSTANYSHCRVVHGFVSLRHLFFVPQLTENGPSNGTTVATYTPNFHFPNLEVITDFLLLYNFNTLNSTGAQSLDTVFPKLRLVAGHNRFLNHTVYIEHFYTDDKIELNALEEVCGSIWLKFVPSVCFRHSDLYWRMMPQSVNWTELFNRNMSELSAKNVVVDNIKDDVLTGRVRIEFSMTKDLRPIWSKFAGVRLSIFDVDPVSFHYLLDGAGQKRADLPKCAKPNKFNKTLLLSDLVDSDYMNTFLQDHVQGHLSSRDPLLTTADGLAEHYITGPSEKLARIFERYNFIKAHFDILSIYEAWIPLADFFSATMQEPYNFKFGHVYLIKVMVCFGPVIQNCTIHKFHRLLPTKGELLIERTCFHLPTSIIILYSHLSSQPRHHPFSVFIRPLLTLLLTDQIRLDLLLLLLNLILRHQDNRLLNSLLTDLNFTTAGLLLAALLCAILVLVLAIRYKQNLKLLFSTRIRRIKAGVISMNPEYTPINNLWSWDNVLAQTNKQNISYEIDRSRLKIFAHKLLGNGEFGTVHEGVLKNVDVKKSHTHHWGDDHPNIGDGHVQIHMSDDDDDCGCHGASSKNQTIRVAIKQLRDNAKELDREKFITEAKYMMTFNNNFLVKLIGVCTVEDPVMVVMEFMENGDLKRFLRQKYKDFTERQLMAMMPNFDSMIRMAIQIADGMYYLHSKRIIHRDLAARNCMVGADLTVKIGDFGLTRHVYEKDYYRLSEQTPMPLRWMAPESVRKTIFTPQTDIWSYGIVLWEIMTFGQQPYKGKTDQDVKEMLLDCIRLNRPPYYNNVIWEICKKCWAKNPNNRPSFRTIIEELYPHLDGYRLVFDEVSFYQSDQAQQDRQSFARLPQLISDHWFEFINKLRQKQNPTQRQNSQQQQPTKCLDQQQLLQKSPSRGSMQGYLDASEATGGQQRSQPPTQANCCIPLGGRSQLSVPLAPNGLRRYGSYRGPQIVPTNIQKNTPRRIRYPSFDSLQTNASAYSEATTLTMISAPYEPSIQSRHNSAGSNKSTNSKKSNVSTDSAVSSGSSGSQRSDTSEEIPLMVRQAA